MEEMPATQAEYFTFYGYRATDENFEKTNTKPEDITLEVFVAIRKELDMALEKYPDKHLVQARMRYIDRAIFDYDGCFKWMKNRNLNPGIKKQEKLAEVKQSLF